LKKINDIKSWNDYWKVFDDLCTSLTNQGKTEIVEEFKDAQKYVNGLTDGWFGFLEKFKTAYKDVITELKVEDKEKSELLIDTLTASLKRR
jgi:hypothetical protein